MDNFSGSWWEKGTIEKVDTDKDGDHLISAGVGCFCLSGKHGVTPKVGDTVELYGDGFGRPIEGVRINGQTVFQNSDEQIEINRKEWIRKNQEEKQRKFDENKAELDKSYEALPPEFRARIDRFRAKNAGFRVNMEGYEMFVCGEAVKMAQALKTVEELKAFHDMSVDDQKLKVPGLDYSNHSGNTFGAACMLAKAYLEVPKLVKYMHGALAPLTGCEEYGCHPLTVEEKAEIEVLSKEYNLPEKEEEVKSR